jgi:hypothetical protein
VSKDDLNSCTIMQVKEIKKELVVVF